MAKALHTDASAVRGATRNRGKLYEQLSPGELDIYITSFAGKFKPIPTEESDLAALTSDQSEKKTDRKRAR